MAFYCGNNYYDMGTKPLGSPYKCMKKGIGAGLHGDLANFSPRYQPIFPNDKYCGNGNPPPGKIQGRPHECLSKGYGIGLKLQYDRQQGGGYQFGDRIEFRHIFILICAIITLVFVQMIFKQWILTFIIAGLSVVSFYIFL